MSASKRSTNPTGSEQGEHLLASHTLLEEAHDRYADLYNFAPLTHVTLDSQGVVLEINLTGTTLLGVARSWVVGMPFVTWVSHPDVPKFVDHIEEAKRTGSLVVCEIELALSERRTLPIELMSRWSSERGVLRTAVIDLTDRKRAEATVRTSTEALEKRTREAELHARNVRMLADALAEAEQRERRRIAHVLHENVQQLIAASKLHIAVAAGMTSDASVQDRLSKARELLGAAIEISRSLTVDLGAAPLDSGLASALRWVTRRMHEWHGLIVELRVGDTGSLPKEIESMLFDSARELLFNVAKHAGVREAVLVLDPKKDEIELAVEDRGCGFAAKSQGFGLEAIRQRAQWLGGALEIKTASTGTRVSVRLPRKPDTRA